MRGFFLARAVRGEYFQYMRIALDARMMGAEATRGIGRYIQELVAAMLEISKTSEEKHTFVLITRQGEHPFFRHPAIETLVADIPWYGVQEQLQMPAVFRRAKADLIHVPHWNIPLGIPGPFVITVHDLLMRHFPQSAKSSTRGWFVRSLKSAGFRVVLDAAVHRSRRILVPSHFVAHDLADLYPDAKAKTTVTGEGMPQIQERPETVGEYTNPYLLYVGSAYPHKGLDTLIAAWPKLSEMHPDLRLKIVGEKDVFMTGLEDEAGSSGLQHIDFLGRVGEEALGRLYAGAAAFVFPSLFEGFGLPPLEALAHGCPVISSDAGSLPEVIGPDNAFFFRAGDTSAMISAVERVLADPAQAHAQARAAARDCARRHAWPEAARATLDAYRAALHDTHAA